MIKCNLHIILLETEAKLVGIKITDRSRTLQKVFPVKYVNCNDNFAMKSHKKNCMWCKNTEE